MRGPIRIIKDWLDSSTQERLEADAITNISVSDILMSDGSLKVYLMIDNLPVEELTSENFNSLLEKVQTLRKVYVEVNRGKPARAC